MTDLSEDLDEESYQLLVSVARGEPLPRNDRQHAIPASVIRRYAPLYHHPLPMSENWAHYMSLLRRVKSCRLDDQVLGAVTFNNPWVLEEVYMCGANPEIADANGFRPIHIACQKNAYECIMVLLNIGVDINAPTVSGVTPLYLARAAGATQVEYLLTEYNAKLIPESRAILPGATVLEPAKGKAKLRPNNF
jgi:hypothetical protein